MHTFADKSKTARQGASVRPKTLRRTHIGHSDDVRAILHAQRMIGNQAKQESIAADSTRGLKPDVEEDEIIRGRTSGEIIGDIARPIGTTLGNVVTSATGVLTGISISTKTNKGPTWNSHGAFV